MLEIHQPFMSQTLLSKLQLAFLAEDIEWAPISHIRSSPSYVAVHAWFIRLIDIRNPIYKRNKE